MRCLAAAPTALLLPEPKEEVFVWNPPTKIIHETRAGLKASQLFPKDRIRVDYGGEEYVVEFPKGQWQLVEAKFVKVEDF